MARKNKPLLMVVTYGGKSYFRIAPRDGLAPMQDVEIDQNDAIRLAKELLLTVGAVNKHKG